jgi:hypothetical protein
LGVLAQEVVNPVILSNNTTDTSNVWRIEGEKSVVIVGFDLAPLNLPKPLTVSALTIDVAQGSGEAVGVLVYEDSNGGSPSDAVLLSSTQTVLGSAGVARIPLPANVTTSANIIWVGFYLPVGFAFRGDTSGSSVLTYWAWTPGGETDVRNLASAGVIGPADGSAPVNLNMNGIARFTAEVTPPIVQTSGFTRANVPLGQQIPGGTPPDFTPMKEYPFCGGLLYDSGDMTHPGLRDLQLTCQADTDQLVPVNGVRNPPERLANGVTTFERAGYTFRLFSPTYAVLHDTSNGVGSSVIPIPVTHCLIPAAQDRDRAILAVAYGAPALWDILPTVRYGDYICAEVTHIGYLTYVLPRSGQEPDRSLNLLIPSIPTYEKPKESIFCATKFNVLVPIRNEGFEKAGNFDVDATIVRVRTGEVVGTGRRGITELLPGYTGLFAIGLTAPDRLPFELYRIDIKLDPNNVIAERNENDNVDSRLTFFLILGQTCK